MKSSLTDELCTVCGLCCDGSLLDDVELSNEKEALGLEVMGLKMDTDDGLAFLLPCTALKGTRCSIYKNRPATCRRFECTLLQSAQLSEISVKDAKVTISKTLKQAEKVRTTCRELEGDKAQGSLREMYQYVFENHDDAKDPLGVYYPRLTQEMAVMDSLITTHFIDE